MRRGYLIIDAGPQRVSGANQAMKQLRGKFMKSLDVQLGDLLTDAAGRLIVLGGHGQSQSLPDSKLEALSPTTTAGAMMLRMARCAPRFD